MNKCSVLLKDALKSEFGEFGKKVKYQCPNEAKYWITIGKLGDLNGSTVWLCEEHTDEIFMWDFG